LISTALVTKLLVIEQLLHSALKSSVSVPRHNFHLCPSSQQILATPLSGSYASPSNYCPGSSPMEGGPPCTGSFRGRCRYCSCVYLPNYKCQWIFGQIKRKLLSPLGALRPVIPTRDVPVDPAGELGPSR